MKSLPRRVLSLLASVLWISSCCAQTAPQNSALPEKPGDLIQLAFQQNGLHGDLKPWHIHVTWQTVDAKGKVQQTGTWEEWWAGKSEFKEVFEQPGFRQTYWATDHGDFISGDSGWPAWIFTELEDLYTPHHSATETGEKFRRAWKNFGKARLQCLSPAKEETNISYCFDTGSPAIQVEIDPPVEVALYGPEFFQSQIVPSSGRLIRLGLPDTVIRLDSIEEMAQVPATPFAPPANAVPVDPRRPEGMDGFVAARVRERGPIPEMPLTLPRTIRHVVIAFDVVVAKDGTVSRVELVGASPGMDVASCLSGAQQWRYHPATWNGRPIATRFTRVFEINR